MRYLPFRETRYASGDTPTTFRFTGQRQEEELGLWRRTAVRPYGARWYDPALGRFVQPDTIVPEPGDPQSWNRYSYVRNRPLVHVDPSGHAETPYDEGGGGLNPLWILASTCTDCAGVAGMFREDPIRGNSASARLATILEATRSYPYPVPAYFEGNAGETGFQQQFQDGYLYEQYWGGGSTNQVGHFITAVALGYRSGVLSHLEGLSLRAIVGHEQHSDSLLSQGIAPVLQLALGGGPESVSLFLRAADADAAGNDPERNQLLYRILGSGWEQRRGNSLEDLLLSVRGWRLGQMIASGELATREQVAAWVEENICEP